MRTYPTDLHSSVCQIQSIGRLVLTLSLIFTMFLGLLPFYPKFAMAEHTHYWAGVLAYQRLATA